MTNWESKSSREENLEKQESEKNKIQNGTRFKKRTCREKIKSE